MNNVLFGNGSDDTRTLVLVGKSIDVDGAKQAVANVDGIANVTNCNFVPEDLIVTKSSDKSWDKIKDDITIALNPL